MKVISDPRRVRQILLNLLSNAIKFGDGKPIRVRCIPQPNGGVVLEVIDQGEGIAPADREKIFDEFVQLGKTQLTEGTGLGLPISRRLARCFRVRWRLNRRRGRAAHSGSSCRRPGKPSQCVGWRTSQLPRRGRRKRQADHRQNVQVVPVTWYRLIAKMLEETPPTPRALHDDVPPALSALVMRTLARDRDTRPATAKALHDALEQLG